MSDTKQNTNETPEPIINKVAQSGLEFIDLETLLPKQEILELDLKDFLFKELIFKEKEFKESLKKVDFSKYENQTVAVFSSVNAIIPHWAYMLVFKYFPQSSSVYLGLKNKVKESIFIETIRNFPIESFTDKRVMVRGCANDEINEKAYFEITKRLIPVVQSLFYGEACSNVPIFKRKSNEKKH